MAKQCICYTCRIFVFKRSFCKYRKRILLKCILLLKPFKSDLIKIMGHMRILGTEPSYDCLLALHFLE